MEYLGVTGVEDKLQEDVLTTIETLRSAGIQVWMLTGDKIETAKCIAISTGLKSRYQEFLEIKDATNYESIEKSLQELDRKISKRLLLIDGQSLTFVLNDKLLEEYFFGIAKNAQSVCVCRCSPT